MLACSALSLQWYFVFPVSINLHVPDARRHYDMSYVR